MRRLQKTIEEIGWTKSVPKFAKGDMVDYLSFAEWLGR